MAFSPFWWRKMDDGRDERSVAKMLKLARRDNLRLALRSLRASMRDRLMFEGLRVTLARLAEGLEKGPGIRAIHFVFGFKQAEEFPFYALIAVLSAQAYHPHAKTFFFVCNEPRGPYWALVKDRVELVRVPDFHWFGIAPVHHYAHKSDVVRMLALAEIGGLYLDCDTITLRSMDELAAYEFVMGVQQTIPGAMGGFCNAIMIGQRNSRFARRWLDTYQAFNSKGRDLHWDFHSVKLPMYLYALAPEEVHVLPHDRWFFPLWNHIRGFLFTRGTAAQNRELLEGQYAIHLWHNMIASALDEWNPERMATEDCLYADLCIEALSALREADRAMLAAVLDLKPTLLGLPPVQVAAETEKLIA